MAWSRLLPVLCVACGEFAPTDPTDAGAGADTAIAERDAASIPADAPPPDPVDAPPSAALPAPSSWGRFYALGRHGHVTSTAVAADGTVYLGVLALGSFEWGGVWVDLETSEAATAILEQRRDGREGWLRVLERGCCTQGARVSAGEDTVYVTLAGEFPGEGYPYVSQTIVALARDGGGERWRWRSPHASLYRYAVGATEAGDDVWVHGNRLWRDSWRVLSEAPFLARLDRDGHLVREWRYDYDQTGTPPPYVLSRNAYGSTVEVHPEADGSIVTTGHYGRGRFGPDGAEVWRHTESYLTPSADAARSPNGELLVVRRQTLLRLDPATGEELGSRDFPGNFWPASLVAHPVTGDILVSGAFDDLVDLDGEMRGAVRTGRLTHPLGANRDIALAWLRPSGEARGVWAFGDLTHDAAPSLALSEHGVVLSGLLAPLGAWPPADVDIGLMTLTRPGPISSQAPFAVAATWPEIARQALPTCRSTQVEPLAPTPLDLHLLFDISAGASQIVPGTGVSLRQLAGNGLAPMLGSLGPDRLSFALVPEPPPPTDRNDRAPWPVVDRRTVSRSGELFSRLVLARTDYPSQLGSFFANFALGARAISLDHVRGAVRHGAIVVLAPSSVPVTWTAEQLAALTSSARPKLPVHVIGLGPPSASLDAVAAAAGTTPVYLPINVNVTEGVADALAEVRAGHRCSRQLARRVEPRVYDVLQVFTVSPVDFKRTPLPRVDACAPGGTGWTLDDRTWTPTIRLCEAACDLVAGGGGVGVEAYDACQ